MWSISRTLIRAPQKVLLLEYWVNINISNFPFEHAFTKPMFHTSMHNFEDASYRIQSEIKRYEGLMMMTCTVIKKCLLCISTTFRAWWPRAGIYLAALRQAGQTCLLLRQFNFSPLCYGSAALTTRSSCCLGSKSKSHVTIQMLSSFTIKFL